MIPTLDLGPYLAGSTEARDELALQLREIQENIGFYVVVNHGVRQAPIDRAYAVLREFFALPLEEKLKVKIDRNSVGYVPFQSTVYVTSKVNENTRKDLNETITIARERAVDDPDIRQGLRFVGPNQWRAGLVGAYRYRTATAPIRGVANVVASSLREAIARSLSSTTLENPLSKFFP